MIIHPSELPELLGFPFYHFPTYEWFQEEAHEYVLGGSLHSKFNFAKMKDFDEE